MSPVRQTTLRRPRRRIPDERRDRGATMAEYSIVVMLIALVSILLVGTVGQQVLELFERALGWW
jgi:Flp pilus assembly pilin Flp